MGSLTAGTSQVDTAWSREPVVYEVYIRSFADGNGDGVGDLIGLRRRLWHLDKLGVDALWVTPFYPSPQHDAGYDISDHTGVDALFGTVAQAESLIAESHAHGLRILVDIVPNHFSTEHPWFQALLAGDNTMRDRFHILEGSGSSGDEPPNDWVSLFGGPAWTRLPDGAWYLHLFDSSQPDLNWANLAVRAEFKRIFRTWLNRGVDGFRIDVAAAMVKAEGYPQYRDSDGFPTFGRPETHEIHREWRQVFDAAGREVLSVGEVFGAPTTQGLLAYAREDELTSIFAFPWLHCEFSAASLQRVAQEWLLLSSEVGALPSWVLGSHDFPRPATRYGSGDLGLSRARAMAMVTLALPGACYLHQGEELGLEEVEIPNEFRQDPTFFRTNGEVLGRDGVRVPLPWSGAEAPFSFTTHGAGAQGAAPWLPQPATWRGQTIADQWSDPLSTAVLYREAIALRRRLLLPAGVSIEWLEFGEDILAFRRGPVTVLLNTGTRAIEMPAGPVILRSDPHGQQGLLPPDAAAWLTCPC